MTKPVTGQTTFGASTTGTTTQLDNNFLLAYNALNDLNTYPNFLTDTGAADAIVVTLGANLTGALTNGLVIQVKAAATNTGATTLNYNSGGTLNVRTLAGAALSAGQIVAGAIIQLAYRASDTSWLLMTPSPGMSPITNSLSGDVSLNNTGNYFDGPSIAQGTAGTWYVSGTVTVLDTAGAANYAIKLWDGTTVIASAFANSNGASIPRTIALSGFLASPAGNIRMSVNDPTSTSGVIKFNSSGNSKDSTITGIRIA